MSEAADSYETYKVAAQGEISTQRGQDGTVKDQTFQLQPQSRASIEDDASVIRGQTSGQTSVLSSIHELGLPAVPPPCHPDSFYIYDDYRVYEDCSFLLCLVQYLHFGPVENSHIATINQWTLP